MNINLEKLSLEFKCNLKIDYEVLVIPELFMRIKEDGKLTSRELFKVFNCGIGYCLVVPSDAAVETELRIFGHGYKSWTIGQVKNCNT